jgi:hypothetical protein
MATKTKSPSIKIKDLKPEKSVDIKAGKKVSNTLH